MTDQHDDIKRAIEDIRKRMKELKPSIAGKKNELRNLTVRFISRRGLMMLTVNDRSMRNI